MTAESSPAAVWQFLRDELTVSPARWSMMVRITVVVAIVIVVSNALRVPSVAVSAYVVVFAARADVASTLRTGIGAMVAATGAIAVTFLVYSLTMCEPAVRLPMMAACTFAGMYLSRTSKLGPLLFLIGFLAAYALTFADRNVSPELLARQLCWLWVFLCYPLALLVLADVVLGRRPDQLFREEVAERLQAAANFLAAPAGEDSAPRRSLERLARAAASLAPYASAGTPAAAAARADVLRQVDLLLLLLRELPGEARRLAGTRDALARAAEACLAEREALLGRDPVRPEALSALEAPLPGAGVSAELLAVLVPLLACLKDLGEAIGESRNPAAPAAAVKPAAPAGLSPAQKTEAVRFAVKVTAAVMIAYVVFNSLDWSGIHTAMITCFFVAQASLGATIHKLTLRLAGAVTGAALGILAIVFILPQLETIGGLVALVAAVTLFAAWIATASPAISYGGMQIAMAFYLTVLQGFTRTSKMVVGRDRVIGILLGNVIISVVFGVLWPVRIKPVVRQALSRAVEALAAALRGAGTKALHEAETGFHAQLEAAAQYAAAGVMEPGEHRGPPLLPAIESLYVPIHAIAGQRIDAEALSAARERMAKWLSDFAASIASERAAPPFQPAAADASGGPVDEPAPARRVRAWLGLLDARIGRVAAAGSGLEAAP